jgi:peptidylprolyl isomerase
MKTKLLISILTLLLVNSTLNAKVLAVVNGENLTEADVKPMLKMFHDANSYNDLNENEKKMILDQTLEKKLIIQKAKKEKIQDNPKFKSVMEDFQNRLLVEFWMKQKLDTIEVSDKEIKESFEKNRANFPKEGKLEAFKKQITQDIKMKKFQVLIDEKLSNMKKEAKIEYK